VVNIFLGLLRFCIFYIFLSLLECGLTLSMVKTAIKVFVMNEGTLMLLIFLGILCRVREGGGAGSGRG
jgi:hypothetical protein